jgi:6-phosphogluconolactonase (cycloisomerase 2 family)
VSALAFGATEAFLYALSTRAGNASILAFRIHPFSTDVNSGALTALPGSPYDLPACNDILSDKAGAFLYATAGTDLYGFAIDPQTGALAPLPGFPVPLGDTADSVSIDPTNQFLYATRLGTGKVAGFKRDVVTGGLTSMPGSPFVVGR